MYVCGYTHTCTCVCAHNHIYMYMHMYMCTLYIPRHALCMLLQWHKDFITWLLENLLQCHQTPPTVFPYREVKIRPQLNLHVHIYMNTPTIETPKTKAIQYN